jgi:hypothetical protein
LDASSYLGQLAPLPTLRSASKSVPFEEEVPSLNARTVAASPMTREQISVAKEQLALDPDPTLQKIHRGRPVRVMARAYTTTDQQCSSTSDRFYALL